jgi:hypothetical protein
VALELYDTQTLIDVQRLQPIEEPMFWLQWFPQAINSTTEDIYFDTVGLDLRMAPFVAPNVQGRIMRERGFATSKFRPAYVKPKHAVDPSRAIPRRVGEPFGGNLSLEARYNAIIADNLAAEKTFITRRWNWMAAQAIIYGAVTVSGEDYPTQTVSFGRDASLSSTLVGTAKWDAVATATPLQDLEDKRQAAFALGHRPVNNLIFGLNAWKWFIRNGDVRDLLSNQRRGSTSDFNVTGIGSPGAFEDRGVISNGDGGSTLRLWTYSDKYEDSTGALIDYLDADTVVGVGDGLNGVRCFGAIRDRRAGLQALDMFPKQWDVEDPSATYTMTQSAPLMVPRLPNNTFKIKVR